MMSLLSFFSSVFLFFFGRYHFLNHNQSSLPQEALAIVRYLDLDLWHTGTQYGHLVSEHDEEIKEWVRSFFHLRNEALQALRFSGREGGSVVDLDGVWPYYQGLLQKYLPMHLDW